MPQSVYSFLGSPLHLVLEDDIAERYNRFVDSFLDAQVEHEKRHGRRWDPNKPLRMKVEKGDNEAYSKVGRVINLLVEINGGGLEISEDQCTSDYLEKVSDLEWPDERPVGNLARFSFDSDKRKAKKPSTGFWKR